MVMMTRGWMVEKGRGPTGSGDETTTTMSALFCFSLANETPLIILILILYFFFFRCWFIPFCPPLRMSPSNACSSE